MATTKIWKVEDNLKRVVEYAINPEKTENPDYGEFEYQGLHNVVDYTTGEIKTEKQLYVSSINCDTSSITEQMIITKKQFNKEEGILAFHGYQSFKGKEATPEEAHQIGIELAQKLWGDRFQVVVSTHLDTDNIHNHFVLNSVSFVDGKRYYDNKSTYKKMQETSDELCKKYQLSVIKNPKRKGKHYAQWQAEQQGKPSWRTIIREDVDACIDSAYTYGQFISNLKSLGYEVIPNRKHITVKLPTKDRNVRLRSLDDDGSYTEDSIKERILNKQSKQPKENKRVVVMKVYYNGQYQKLTKKKMSGLRGLYFHYLYKMGSIPKTHPNNRRTYAILKDDILKLDKLTKEAILLNTNRIETIDQLSTYKNGLIHRVTILGNDRKQLYNRLRRSNDKEDIKQQISLISGEIFSLRKEVVLCENIEIRSISMKNKLKKIQEKGKEEERNESRWRSR